MNTIKQFITNTMAAMLVMTSLFGVTLIAQPVHAQNSDSACEGIMIAGGSCDVDEGNTGISSVITTIIDVLSIIVGAVSVIMIIIGGLRYITSSGDSAAVTSAKNTILYAIVGLVIVIFAQAIIAFVVGRVDGDAADTTSLNSSSIVQLG